MKKITVAVVGLSFGMEFVPIYREHPGVRTIFILSKLSKNIGALLPVS